MKKTTLNTITKILNDYFEGKTTCEQEKELHAYFSQTTVDPSLEKYQALFQTLNQLKSNYQPFKAEEKKNHSRISIPVYKRRLITISSIAASIAAIFLIVFLTYKPLRTIDYVIIDGVKYTDSEKIETAMQHSLENVKIETQDFFSEFNDLDLESLK
ncbi:MAG: hypothetical protein RBS13_01025 [Bacteroidales bacterium]|jgi:hypothetical protein|nr:hypothetical protein [Bacteroidales bacterium]